MPRIETSDIRNPNINQGTTSRSAVTNTAGNTPVVSSRSIASQLVEGHVFKGEVIDLRQSDIKLLINNSMTLSATLKGVHALSIGDRATFKVIQSNSSGIALKLMGNTTGQSIENTVEKALNAAGLPVTERNATAVHELLAARMSVDKNSIFNLLQLSSDYRDVSMQTLVRLMQLSLPVTDENVKNMEAYNQYENRLLPLLNNSLDNILTDLSDTGISVNSKTNLFSLITDILMSEPESASLLSKPLDQLLSKEEASVLVNTINENSPDLPLSTSVSLSDFLRTVNSLINQESNNIDKQTGTAPSVNGNAVSDITPDSGRLSGIQESADTNLLSEAVITDKTASSGIPHNEHPYNTELQNANGTAAINYDNNPPMNTIFNLPEFQSLIHTALLHHWSVSPDRLVITDHTPEKILEQIEHEVNMLKSFEHYSGNDEKSSSGNGNLSQNLSFIQTMNEVFPYIQLPVQLKGQTIHSELFVYANKKKHQGASKDEISVMLHLDMESLGAMDIRIEMSLKNITTKFYVNDSVSERLINENLPLLDKALADKGFILKSEVMNHIKGRNPLEDFLASELPDSSIKRYTFDVRA